MVVGQCTPLQFFSVIGCGDMLTLILTRRAQVTVILCFYNEEWFALLRSVWGVIMNSPEEIVDEILLVDDGSTMRHLGSLLDEYLEALPFLKVLSALSDARRNYVSRRTEC